MKPQPPTGDDRPLHGLLAEWKTDASLPPRFQEQVWQRIARQGPRPAAAPWQLLANWVEQALARPSLALSYVTVLLAVGLLSGFWQAESARARAAETLSARYVQLVDPYQNPHH